MEVRVMTAVRLLPKERDAIDTRAVVMQRTRSDVLRAAVRIGLAALEAADPTRVRRSEPPNEDRGREAA
jgi:hypothetical protein